MRPPVKILLLLLVIGTRTTLCVDVSDYKPEGHRIMKRMAEMGRGFEEHDVATFHLVEGQEEPGRRLVKRDIRDMNNILDRSRKILFQLALSSGSKVNLGLKQASIVDHNTVVSSHTSGRQTTRTLSRMDCYSHGHAEDSSGKGWAAISHCDGVFGFASSGGYEYFLHPVESRRSKRETTIENDDDYDVHLMWRRSVPNDVDPDEWDDFIPPDDEDDDEKDVTEIVGRERRNADGGMSSVDRENSQGFVIEMGIFSDAKYCQQLQYLYPGREDDFLLTRLAGVQGLFGSREKAAYDIKIKVKHLEYWYTDPVNYTFSESLPANMRSFCSVTKKKYFFDVHALNTGIVKWNAGLIGLAFIGGACTGSRCMVVKGTDLDSFRGYAHEVGHTLGISHFSRCPKGMKFEGGFMGGRSPLNFSPCMQHMLAKYLSTSKSNCLFRESDVGASAEEFDALPSLFPGQVKSPDGLCHLMAGRDFRYVPNERPPGVAACKWFMCLNDNENSDEFRRARAYTAPIGFPCKTDAYCHLDQSCRLWDEVKISLEAETLRSLKRIPEWSEWSTDYTKCSRPCGTGVRTRRRVCQYPGYNLAPYCPGRSLHPELCNTHPCPGDQLSAWAVRKGMGDGVCSRFLEKNVRLRLKKTNAYLATASQVTLDDAGQNMGVFDSKSCLIKCDRDIQDARGDLDAVMPDGTPCEENKRTMYDLDRLNTTMRCIGGHCLEVTDCPHILQTKDDCGICGGDGSRCVKLDFDSAYNVPRTGRKFLADIPAFATKIDVRADPKKNMGIVLELWSNDERNIIGNGGQYPRTEEYKNSNAVKFAGTEWTYDPKEPYLRAPGPITEPVKIKYTRLGTPLRIITINYAKDV